jgi:hypothetical protein
MTFENSQDSYKKMLFMLNKFLSEKETIEIADMILNETSTIQDIENRLIEFENAENAQNTEGVGETEIIEEKKKSHAIKMIISEKTVSTISYYNEVFVSKARKLKGTWANNMWNFDKAVMSHVEKAMLHCYGVTGLEPYEVCILAVNNFSDYGNQCGVELFGRPIAKAFGRDTGAKISEDIFFIDGNATSGGSMKNWTTRVSGDFEIHNFPIAALQREDVKQYIENGKCIVKY